MLQGMLHSNMLTILFLLLTSCSNPEPRTIQVYCHETTTCYWAFEELEAQGCVPVLVTDPELADIVLRANELVPEDACATLE